MSSIEKIPSAVLRSNGTSLHRQLFLVLREQIVRGVHAPGSALPTEELLCKQFGVSRITVRRALADLEAEGYIERRHGRGTFVRDDPPGATLASPLPFVEGLRKIALETQVDLLEAGRRRAPPHIAILLCLSTASKVHGGSIEAVYALRLRRSGDIPLMVTEAWLPPRFIGVAKAAALRKHPLYEILLKAGVAFGRVIQEVSAESADPLRAQLLATDIGAPLLRLTRLVHDTAGQPVQHLTVHLSPERSRLVMDIAADDVDSLNAGYVAHDVARALRTGGEGRRR